MEVIMNTSKTLLIVFLLSKLLLCNSFAQDSSHVTGDIASDEQINLNKVSIEKMLPSIDYIFLPRIHGTQYINKGRKRFIKERKCFVKSFSNGDTHLNVDVRFHDGYEKVTEGSLAGFDFPINSKTQSIILTDYDGIEGPFYKIIVSENTVTLVDMHHSSNELLLQFSGPEMTRENLESVTITDGGFMGASRTCHF
jgi:hypothetical protein